MAQAPEEERGCGQVPGIGPIPGRIPPATALTELLRPWSWSNVQTSYVSAGQTVFLRILAPNDAQTQYCLPATPEPVTLDHQSDLNQVVVKALPVNYTVELSKNVATEAAAVALWRQLQQLGIEAKYIKRAVVRADLEIVKQDYFDEVLAVIQRYRPEVTEEILLTADNVARLEPLPFFGRRRLYREPELTYAVVARIGRDSIGLLYQAGLRVFQGR